jgi:hypothetical protein
MVSVALQGPAGTASVLNYPTSSRSVSIGGGCQPLSMAPRPSLKSITLPGDNHQEEHGEPWIQLFPPPAVQGAEKGSQTQQLYIRHHGGGALKCFLSPG